MTTGLLFPDLYPSGQAPQAKPKRAAPTARAILASAVDTGARRVRARERLRRRGWRIILPVEPIPETDDFYGDPDAADYCDDDGCCNETRSLESSFPECPVCCAHWCDACWRDSGGRCGNGCSNDCGGRKPE